ncbi:MAG: rod shape-determining protein MreC [Bacteroidetes bacterium]|nr:rod shape-determining protein MreC [Bacteroidota bacterium]
MRNFFLFLLKEHFFFLFFILEVFSFVLIIQNNYYQKSVFINSSNEFTGGVFKTFNDISQYFSLKDANRKLSEENARLMNEAKKYYFKSNNNVFSQIDTLFHNDTLYVQQYEFVSAKVINNSINKRNNYLTINKGSNNGITKDMGVITSDGIVGIVMDVSPHFSSILSVLHKDSKISAKVKKNGHLGTVIWKGGAYRTAELIDIPTHVKPSIGDTIITSGNSTSFPEGINIGTILSYKIEKGDNFYNISIKLSTDFNNISYAYVIKNIMKGELDKINKNEIND